jgi:hypothetical protein
MSLFINMTDRRYGRLVVLYMYRRTSTDTYWWCQCDCGTTKQVGGKHLRSYHTQSCGCLLREMLAVMHYRHGRSLTPEYRLWAGMMGRCLNPQNKSFINYGGRGITVCQRWQHFEYWYADMGERPAQMTNERRDNDGHYSCGTCDECLTNGWPSNCYWATQVQQARNKRNNRNFTINGRTQCLVAWAREYGLKREAVSRRLARGKSIEEALKPIHEIQLVTYLGITQSIFEWSQQIGIETDTLVYRVKHWDIERAFTAPVQTHTKGVQ